MMSNQSLPFSTAFRTVQCGACGTKQTADQVMARGGCVECGEMLCMFCGCTEFNPCLQGCAWAAPFICSADLHCVIKEVIQTFGGEAGRETARVLQARAMAL